MEVVALALLASTLWGISDFGGGLLSRRLPAALILFGQQLAGAAIVLVVIVAVGESPPGGSALVLAAAAGAAGAFALGLFYRGLAVGTMSIVAPISASGVTLPVAVGLATGDDPTAVQGLGLVMTLAGVVLASREAVDESAEQHADARSAIPLALLAAVGFGAYFTLSDSAADDSVLWLLLVGRSTAVALMIVFLLVKRGSVKVGGRDALAICGIGAFDLAATGLYALANTKGLLSIVAVVGALYPVATVLLARFLLHERIRRIQAAGVALAFAGVAAVVAGG